MIKGCWLNSVWMEWLGIQLSIECVGGGAGSIYDGFFFDFLTVALHTSMLRFLHVDCKYIPYSSTPSCSRYNIVESRL
jgi:hypothetical protein